MNNLMTINDKISAFQVMAKAAFQSGFFKGAGGEQAILTILLMADELKIGYMEALAGGINVIQGKPEISPRLMNKLIRQAGHKLNIESTDTHCKITGERHDTKEMYSCSYTIDDARRAGLIRSGGSWDKYPSDMLFARCLSRLCRRLFPDVISVAYIENEIEEAEIRPSDMDVPKKASEIEQMLTEEQSREIEELVGADVDLKGRILNGYKVESLSQIGEKHYKAIITNLQKRKTNGETHSN